MVIDLDERNVTFTDLACMAHGVRHLGFLWPLEPGNHFVLRLQTFSGALTAVKREKFAENKKNTSKEGLSLLLYKV